MGWRLWLKTQTPYFATFCWIPVSVNSSSAKAHAMCGSRSCVIPNSMLLSPTIHLLKISADGWSACKLKESGDVMLFFWLINCLNVFKQCRFWKMNFKGSTFWTENLKWLWVQRHVAYGSWTCTHIGNKADTFVNVSAINVDAPPSGRGQPRGRGWGRLMCARVLAATSSSDKRKRQISLQRILHHHVSKVTVKTTLWRFSPPPSLELYCVEAMQLQMLCSCVANVVANAIGSCVEQV